MGNNFLPVLMLFLGAAAGAACAWLLIRGRIEQARREATGRSEVELATQVERLAARDRTIADMQKAADRARTDNETLHATIAELRQQSVKLSTTLDEQRKHMAERLASFEQTRQEFTTAFKALAADALSTNNDSFLKLANASLEKFQETARLDLDKRQAAIGSVVEPVKQSLEKVQGHIRELETVRLQAYVGLSQQVKSLVETEQMLRSETANLVKALRAPNVRGRWGEIQLRRVVELAGMLEHCDFREQVSENIEGGRLRPDMIIHLPGEIQVVVDAKVPLAAFLEAIEATDDLTRAQKLKDHVRQLRTHIGALSAKSYWENFQPSPDFVILFLPGEAFYNAALEQDPELVETAIGQRVMIATPMSLITLLRTVAFGWRQQSVAHNAQEISDLGKMLYDRLATLGDHLITLGRSLDGAVEAYNKTIGNVETRVLSAARKFRDLGASDSSKEIPEPSAVESTPRKLQKIELLPAADGLAANRARQEGIETVRAADTLR
jgi:DNA recombination protein RmuC